MASMNRNRSSQFVHAIFGVLFVAIMALPRAFYEFKIIPLFFCLLYAVSAIIKSRKIYYGSAVFYGVQFAVCFIWVFLGLLYGNNTTALLETSRLYILWGLLFFLLVNGMCNIDVETVIDRSVFWATILICASIFLVVIESWLDLQIIQDDIREELNGLVGFHDGYVQVALHSIGSLFFLVPYLIVSVLGGSEANAKGKRILLFVSLVAAALTGRRALWLVVGVAFSYVLVRRLYRDVGNTALILFSLIIAGFAIYVLSGIDVSFLGDTYDHLAQAFGSDDERSIQNVYLMEKFFERPILGAGIGFEVPYIRNIDRPWLYESTYHVLLAGLGVVGFFIVAIDIAYFFVTDWIFVSSKTSLPLVGKSTLVGVLGLLIAAYSNPYFGSFDFLFYLSFLPLIFDAKKNPSSNYKL